MSLYAPVKYALMIILLIGTVVLIVTLAPEISDKRLSNEKLAVSVLMLLTLLIGLFGAYNDNRQLLIGFALIMTILVIINVVQKQEMAVIGNAVLDVVAIVLAVYQSEMIRTGI